MRGQKNAYPSQGVRLLTLHCSLQNIPADAYYGSNTTLRETMNNLILKQPQSWQTSVGLPFFQIQGTVSQDPRISPAVGHFLPSTHAYRLFCALFLDIQVVEWDEIRFDVRLMQRVPYEGTSRMTTSLKRRHRDRVVRRVSRRLPIQLASMRLCLQS